MKRILALLMCITLLMCGCSGDKSIKEDVEIYFSNAEKTGVESETRKIKYLPEENKIMVILEELLKGPENTNLKSIIPKDTKVNEVITNNNLVIIDFSKEFISENETDNLIIRACVVHTVTSVPGIENVLITVEGDNLKDDRDNIIGIIKKGDIICDAELSKETDMYVKLYFADNDLIALVPEGREITVSQNETTEMKIVKELIKGPEKNGLYKSIPSETKIISIETKEGVCFVNLSQDFISKNSGSISTQTLSVYSMVNSLTELDTVTKVQFLIEGQKVESFIDMVFNEPFERDEGLIRQ